MIKHTNAIDRNSSVPLYKQIKEILIEEMLAANGETGRPFSTEHELVHRFHVSRAPVRQALKELADEGYVYRERAKGTFPVQELPVRPPGLELGGLVSFLRDQGLECTSKIIDAEPVLPNENLSAILGLEPSETVFRTSRLISLKGRLLYGRRPICLLRRISGLIEGNLRKSIVSSCSLKANKAFSYPEVITRFVRQVRTLRKQSF